MEAFIFTHSFNTIHETLLSVRHFYRSWGHSSDGNPLPSETLHFTDRAAQQNKMHNNESDGDCYGELQISRMDGVTGLAVSTDRGHRVMKLVGIHHLCSHLSLTSSPTHSFLYPSSHPKPKLGQ